MARLSTSPNFKGLFQNLRVPFSIYNWSSTTTMMSQYPLPVQT